MSSENHASAGTVRILLADSRPLQSELLAQALRDQRFSVLCCLAEPGAILDFLERNPFDVLIMSVPQNVSDMPGLRTVHLTTPQLAKIALLDGDSRAAVCRRSGQVREVFFASRTRRFPRSANAFCGFIAGKFGLRGATWGICSIPSARRRACRC